jgi:hypothetical protein
MAADCAGMCKGYDADGEKDDHAKSISRVKGI